VEALPPTLEDERLAFSFDVPWAGDSAPGLGNLEAPERLRDDGLSDAVLAENAEWFCRLRWFCIAFLVLFGLAGAVPGLFARVGLSPRPLWPFAVAGLLALCNLGFLLHAAAMRRSHVPYAGRESLWTQIVADLILLTVVFHCAGSGETEVRMAYLFHIVLACVFFPPRQSILVLLLAGVLYSSCVLLEAYGVLERRHLFVAATERFPAPLTELKEVLDAVSAPLVWFVVWYLTSFLSEMVRGRDEELAVANARLEAAEKERAGHLLLTTHELKAPFAAIHANAQLLAKGYCGRLPDQALSVVQRIVARSRRLGHEIQEMLQLANLDSATQSPPDRSAVDLTQALRWSLEQVRPLAEERQVRMDAELGPGQLLTWASEDHLKMLFSNLLTNAVTYSRSSGCVTIRCRPGSGEGPEVTIRDRGIGIAPAKLPRVFEEYYRTEEAVAHFRESTGLGLAIVQRILQSGRIGATVSSEPGVGTRWLLRFPLPENPERVAGVESQEIS
jgi:signal transduction histidine kinase